MKRRLMIIATLVLAMCYIAKAENKVTISDFEISAGETKEVSISLDNDEAYVAFQFDLYLPEGITIESQSADRSRVPEQTTVDMARLSNGSYRFISTAISGESLTGNSGGIVKLTVKASKNLEIGEKTGYFRKVKLSKSDATGPTYEEMSFTVNVVEPSVVTAKSYSRVYGDANPTFEYTVEGATLNGSPSITCEATATSPVGTYTITIAKGDVTNENVTLVNGTLTITKAPLTIKAGEYTKTQGEDNPEFTLTYEGFKNNETSEVLTTKPTVSCEATKESAVGEYVVTVSGAEATNYEISYTNGKLTISEAPVTITATSYSREYGEANPTFEYTSTGATLNGTPTITCEATATSPVGTYPITIAKGDVTNENVTLVNGTLTITKAPLTIKAGEYTKTQGEDNPEFTLTYEGFKNNETSEVLTTKPTVSCEATKESAVGEYVVTVSGAEATNYEISYTNGKLTINEAPVTITATSYSREYGEANPTFEYTSTGATLNGTPTITCEATATSPVGTYPITIAKGDVTNGNVTLVNGTLTITKASLTIKAGEYTKTQGEDNPTFTLTYEGFKNNETSEVLTTKPIVSCEATKESAVGEYTVTVSGAEATNYEISYTNGKLTIKPVEFVVDTGSEGEGSGETQVTYAITNNGNSEESETPTVAVSDGGDAKGDYEIPETVEYNGVVYTVTEIADNAFQNNTALTDITIPSTIESIGDNAFAGCSSLESITVNIETPIGLSSTAATRGVGTRGNGSAVFEGVNKETCKLYVPEGSVEKYKAADVWKEFVNILPIASSGIRTILNTDGRAFDVFDLNGHKVKAKTISTEGLPKGVYIINNKKVVIR